MVSSVAYVSLIFSEMSETKEQKYIFGWALMFMISVTFLINMMIVFLMTAKNVYLLAKKAAVYLNLIKSYIVESDFIQDNFVK